jgi:hypothetical protein
MAVNYRGKKFYNIGPWPYPQIPAMSERSSLMGPFLSYDDNNIFGILSLIPYNKTFMVLLIPYCGKLVWL